MCVGGGGSSYPQPQRPEFDDSPPVVTGMQTGVENPKDKRKKELTLTLTLQQLKRNYQEVVEVILQNNNKQVEMQLETGQKIWLVLD
jgi:hypothetical protein